MVGQSDLPFRTLVRHHGATVVFSEMLLANEFAASPLYREQSFGAGIKDHPLVVQFAANETAQFAAAAQFAEAMGADGVDLNLGCPQDRAKYAHYGCTSTRCCSAHQRVNDCLWQRG